MSFCSYDNCNRPVLAKTLCTSHYNQRQRGQCLHPLRSYKMGAADLREMSDVEIAWVAGVLEGEGWFGITRYGPRLQLKMTDLDVIETVVETTGGCGSIRKASAARERRKAVWSWHLSGSAARLLMERILPFMGNRRAARIKEILDA